ncbi:hypothetical protein AAFF_G00107650 [Aldrovandia affinis]|uniref:Uncharacterized protein n=1 Tax=Aldrovandia affinis TaxID=143900 RepID=A0AAD7WAW4_9TELE|nr:hypothetical protein AAFF_G00107650 [Aldrovandia affinis]
MNNAVSGAEGTVVCYGDTMVDKEALQANTRWPLPPRLALAWVPLSSTRISWDTFAPPPARLHPTTTLQEVTPLSVWDAIKT